MPATPPPAAPDPSAGSAQRPPSPQRRGVPAWLVWVVAAIIAIVFGLGSGWLGARLGGATTSSSRTTSTGTAAGSKSGSCDAVSVANDVLPTIVTINVSTSSESGVGSGEIVRKDGYIVTNNHVISPAANGGLITVTFSNGHTERATLVGRDPRSDLAVLKVSVDSDLPVIGIGNSENIAVGQPVVALGAPLGLSSTVTGGIVSALGRNVPVPSDNDQTTVLAGAIQTDAAINPGNSGGALVDCKGDLLGVNTAIATVPNEEGTGGGGSVGIGFAVPVNFAMRVTNDLIKNGEVSYAYFGLEVTPIPQAVADRWGIEDGLYVQEVDSAGSAAKAGLKHGDIITKIDGQTATNSDLLTHVALTKKAGDTVQITYVRDGTEHTVTATLVGQP
ncbi:PDZ domain-containing protein [Humibacter ginsenosidimutans]|uniref:PDZ domain-containing protein n=2 Tax=Humibacter ginsenosidimutans TaxID=2599293 RepID=A0A5B8M8D0_9MICO|nr:PDZ domain-containing protein [Humibacter ginsenosidimutans]